MIVFCGTHLEIPPGFVPEYLWEEQGAKSLLGLCFSL